MSSDVLDDYLEELLLDATAPVAVVELPALVHTAVGVELEQNPSDAAPAASASMIAEPLPAVAAAAEPAVAPASPVAHSTGPEHVPAAAPAPPAVPVAAKPERPAVSAAPAPSPVPASNTIWNELQAQALQIARPPQNRRASERASRWLRLRCGRQTYALELLKVQEVVLPVPLLALRGTGPSMLGIMNLRGQVVPVMDLGLHLGTGPVDNDANTRIVVLEEHGETLGLRVSAVEDVASLSDSQIEPPDTTRICQISNDLFRGVARLGQQPMILLDASYLLH